MSLLRKTTPPGYFIVFHEITGMVVDLINAGLSVNDKTVPDISVGLLWGKFWNDCELEKQFGKRRSWSHNFPPYYRQAKSNPQAACAYPNEALAEFRNWFSNTYLPTKFPTYILRKAMLLKGGKAEAEQIASVFRRDAIEE